MEFRSHFGVYALILNEQKDSILLIKKARGPYMGQYDLPGGSMEDGELFEDTLVREVREETMCDLVDFYQLKAVNVKFTYMKGEEERLFRHVGVLYIGEVKGHPSKLGDGLDSNGAEWISLKDIQQIKITPFVKLGLAEIQHIFQMEDWVAG